MKYYKTIFLLLLALMFLLPISETFAGSGMNDRWRFPETDSTEDKLAAVFDLRDRETNIQITNTGIDRGADQEPISNPDNLTVHVQIFNVANNCDENNFFDVYTPADTHIYNMRDIQTNDGNPSGVTLPDDAYGIIIISVVEFAGGPFQTGLDQLLGNIRILDDSGYEYRTNIASDTVNTQNFNPTLINPSVTFNFNSNSGIIFSDVMGFNFIEGDDDDDTPGEVEISNILDVYTGWDVDIINNNEVAQSCRNIIFSCVDEDNPLLESLLEEVADENDGFSASVASFEYGINETIPHSRGSELLCPGNITPEGFVILKLNTFQVAAQGDNSEHFIGYIGLNNGNSRGSFDSFWYENLLPVNAQQGG